MMTAADCVRRFRGGAGILALAGLALTMSACGSEETAEFDGDDQQTEQAAGGEDAAGDETAPEAASAAGEADETGESGVPGVEFPDPDDAIAEEVFTAPGTEGTQVRVGIEEIIVTERTMELRLLLTPEGGEDMTASGMLGHQRGATLIDRENLKEYGAVNYSGQYYGTDAHVEMPSGQTVGFQRFYAPPEDDITEIDVVLDLSWPPFEDVPLTVED